MAETQIPTRNHITKVALVAFGLIALFAYLAPFRQQAVNANNCAEMKARVERHRWQEDNEPDDVPTDNRTRWFRATAYAWCGR